MLCKWKLYLSFLGIVNVLSTLGARFVNMAVYEQRQTTSEYIYASGLPQLEAFTICMWHNALTSIQEDDHLISIANSYSSNELKIYFSSLDRTNLKVYFSKSGRYYSMISTSLDMVMIGWHRHCWCWESGEYFKWYTTVNDPLVLEVFQQVSTGKATIRSGGSLVLYLDQDSILGDFNADEISEAKVAGFNMWDYQLTSDQINELTCESQGNLIKPSQLQLGGGASYSYEDLDCNPGYQEPRQRNQTGRVHIISMAKTEGARLSGHSYSTTSGIKLNQCLLRCTVDNRCLSVNYSTESRQCDLNNADQTNIAAIDFDRKADLKHLYFQL